MRAHEHQYKPNHITCNRFLIITPICKYEQHKIIITNTSHNTQQKQTKYTWHQHVQWQWTTHARTNNNHQKHTHTTKPKTCADKHVICKICDPPPHIPEIICMHVVFLKQTNSMRMWLSVCATTPVNSAYWINCTKAPRHFFHIQFERLTDK